VTKVAGKEVWLLEVVLQQMNMTFVHVPTPEGFEIEKVSTDNLITAILAKEAYRALGDLGTHILLDSLFDTTSTYFIMSYRWHVPCSEKYARWSSIFIIPSVELWIVLITCISIVIAAISTTLVGRYSCTSEWQG
jgi:hypothetical protein